MLRITFTSEDLARVRIALRPDPLWETILSVHQLGATRRTAAPYAQWAGWVRVAGRDRIAPPGRVLHELAGPRRYFPDFLTPAVAREQGLDAGIDAIRRTPRRRLAAEIARTGASSRLPPWAHDLAAGDPARLDWLGRVVRTYHRHALAPFQDRISAHLDAHRAEAMTTLAAGGPETLLRRLPGTLGWRGPVLTTRYPVDLSIDLAGRGITLVPSFFCRGAPITLADGDLDPILVYPIDPPADWLQPAPASGRDRHLAALVGEPRARLLRALTAPAGTGALAARTGMASSSASEHATVLRNAGLIGSTRRGRYVEHSLTPLGRRLLAGDLPQAPPDGPATA